MDCSTDDKFSLLRYLLSSNQYNILEGLCLLPLQNGSFIKFNRTNRSTNIFKTSRSKMQLLVGMEDHLLQDLPTDIDELFSTLISKGTVVWGNCQDVTSIILLILTSNLTPFMSILIYYNIKPL